MNECSIFQCNFFSRKFAIGCQGKIGSQAVLVAQCWIIPKIFQATSCWKIHFVWHDEFLLKSLLLQQNFVTVISHMNSNWFQSGQLISQQQNVKLLHVRPVPTTCCPDYLDLYFISMAMCNSYSRISFYWYSALLLILERVIFIPSMFSTGENHDYQLNSQTELVYESSDNAGITETDFQMQKKLDQRRRRGIVLWLRPITTLKYFLLELGILLNDYTER